MSESLAQQAHRAAIDAVTPSQFTVGGYVRNGRLVGGVTYSRTWKNGWGVTAYARAYWDDLPVSVGRPKGEAGVEAVKRF